MREPPFLQDAPVLGDPWSKDSMLRAWLRRSLAGDLPRFAPDLQRFSQRVTTDVLALARQAEAEEPRHVPFDPWGRRVDTLVLSPAWDALSDVAAEEGLVAIGYERPAGAASRALQFAKLYLFGASSAIFNCPLAMTDGAARLLEGLPERRPELQDAFDRLTTRDPARFWTSGQWMTERTGGSDVSGTETLADADGDGWYRLDGVKWFSSSTASPMAIALGRVRQDGQTVPGSRGLSVFFVPMHRDDGSLNGIEVLRLKDKLGTRALPTAELRLAGTRALRVGEVGRGVPTIATLVNVTRLHNSVAAISLFRRALDLAQDYATRRRAFGKLLIDQPLHAETLARLEVECRAAFALTFRCADLLGREDVGDATPAEQAELRLLTPLTKLCTARQTVAGVSEVLECFGGAGYVEDTGLPRLLRDAQVLPIWEGTTNVLSLDTLRAMRREDALGPTLQAARARLRDVPPALTRAAAQVEQALDGVVALLGDLESRGPVALEAFARDFAWGFARALAGSLLVEHAQDAAEDPLAVPAARRFAATLRTPVCGDDDDAALLARG